MPGTYSLSARSAEEQNRALGSARPGQYTAGPVRVRASTPGNFRAISTWPCSCAELGLPMVVALNMIDEAGDNPPNPRRSSGCLGVPVVAISARRGGGVVRAVGRARARARRPSHAAPTGRLPGGALGRRRPRFRQSLPAPLRATPDRARASRCGRCRSIDDGRRARRHRSGAARATLALRKTSPRDRDREMIAARYAYIDARLPELYKRLDRHPRKRRPSERADRCCCTPFGGSRCFMSVMLVVFQSLFSWSDPAIGADRGRLRVARGAASRASLPAGHSARLR